MRLWLLARKGASPVASASSMSSTSWLLARRSRSAAAIPYRSIGSHRQVDEIADSGELHDVAVAALDFLRAHSHRQAAEHDIPLTREVVEQRGVDAEKGRLTRGVDGALLRGQQARDSPQQRRFARAVPPDDPDCVAAVGHERNAANGVHFPQTRAILPTQDPHQGGRGRALAAARTVNAVHDVQVVDDHHRLCHRHASPSASRGDMRKPKGWPGPGAVRCLALYPNSGRHFMWPLSTPDRETSRSARHFGYKM